MTHSLVLAPGGFRQEPRGSSRSGYVESPRGGREARGLRARRRRSQRWRGAAIACRCVDCFISGLQGEGDVSRVLCYGRSLAPAVGLMRLWILKRACGRRAERLLEWCRGVNFVEPFGIRSGCRFAGIEHVSGVDHSRPDSGKKKLQRSPSFVEALF